MSNHINAKKHQVAKTVFMAGDPNRVKVFVEKYLEDYEIINTVRNETAYTGKLNGKKISVFSHGMGLDSIGIYAFELFSEYGVENIIRFGSAGSYNEDVKILDFIIANEAYTESNYGLAFGEKNNTIYASKKLLELSRSINKKYFKDEKNIREGKVHSSMWFYTKPNFIDIKKMQEEKVLVVEMEAYALYAIANYFNKNALTVLSVSDSLVTNESLSSNDRETRFNLMFDFIAKMSDELE